MFRGPFILSKGDGNDLACRVAVPTLKLLSYRWDSVEKALSIATPRPLSIKCPGFERFRVSGLGFRGLGV